jgi:hypothetical protein
MATRQWIQMPAAGGASVGQTARPKYPVDTSALLVYRGPNVYISFSSDASDSEALKQPDVRRLTPDEIRRLEQSFPFPLPVPGVNRHGGPARLGDLVSRLTGRLGIAECRGCQGRRTFLNNLVVWGWWRRPHG